MKKIKLNAYVNILSLISLILSAISGLILLWVLPNGTGKLGAIFLNISRHYWVYLHNYSSLIFLGFMVLHLLLHFNWIKNLFNILKS